MFRRISPTLGDSWELVRQGRTLGELEKHDAGRTSRTARSEARRWFGSGS